MNIFKKIRKLIYYQKINILTFDTSAQDQGFQVKIPLQFSEASLAEIEELNRNSQWDLSLHPLEFLKEKRGTGSWKFLVAKSDGEIAAHACYSFNEMKIVGSREIEFELPPDTAYVFRMFVHPKFRGLQIHRQLENFRLKEVNKSGAASAFTAVNSTNVFSLDSCLKMGATVVGSVTFVKTRFFNKVFVSKSLYKTGLKRKGTLPKHMKSNW